MRRVFSSHQDCADVWAQQRQESGTTGKGRVFFEGEIIYSYGRHFPMARFIDNANGERVVLVNESRYSVSTSKHQGIVRHVLHRHHPNMQRIYVPTQLLHVWFPEDAIKHYASAAREVIELWKKARSNKSLHEEGLLGYMHRINTISSEWNLNTQYPTDSFAEARLAVELDLEAKE